MSLPQTRPLAIARFTVAFLIWSCLKTSADNVEDSPIERFKALLSSPPVIQQLVYSKVLPDAGRVAVRLDIGLMGATNQELYELRWQTNAFFHRQLFSLDHALDNEIRGECFSLWNSHFYFLDARTKPCLYVLERNEAARGIYPDAYHAAHIRMTHAAEVLNLGLSHLTPGTLRWERDRFSLTTMGDKKPLFIRGAISGLTNGIPSELRVQYSNDVGIANYRIAYSYDAYRAPWFPSQIDTYFLQSGKEILYSRYRILKAITAKDPMPENQFVPARWLTRDFQALLYLTNNSTYAQLPSGQFVEVPTAIPTFHLTSKDYLKSRFYYACAVSWTFLFLVLGLRTWQQNNLNKAQKE